MMLDERPLLGSNDEDDIRQTMKKAENTGKYVFRIICQILRHWKLFLVAVGLFALFYLIIHPANVFKLDNMVQLHHHPFTVKQVKGIMKLNIVDM